MERLLPIREAVVTRLRASGFILAFVPAESVHGERPPPDRQYPFIMLGDPSAAPFFTSCWRGDAVTFTVDAFVKGPASDRAANLGAAIRLELDGAVLLLYDPDGVEIGDCVLHWQGGGVIRDRDEPDTWHVVQTFEAV